MNHKFMIKVLCSIVCLLVGQSAVIAQTNTQWDAEVDAAIATAFRMYRPEACLPTDERRDATPYWMPSAPKLAGEGARAFSACAIELQDS